MSDVVAKCDNEKITKVKVASAEIIVSGKADKPYYEIKYYDLSKNEWCIGYGSYELKFVFQWLNECFELAKEPQECNSDLISKLAEDFYYIENGKIHPYTGNYGETDYDESVDLIECINNQPQVHQWISCSERLPKETGYYLCSVEWYGTSTKELLISNGHEIQDRIMLIHYLESNKSFKEIENFSTYKVIAWQPLPSVWKGENNG